MVLYLASDLLWATRIKSTADALGVPCRPARTMDMLCARLADSPVKALILDLEAGETAFTMLAHVRPARPDVRVVVFGPHVMADQLRAAQVGGADQVLARGAFSERLPELLRQLGGAQAGPTGPG